MKKLVLSAVVLAAFSLSANAQEGEKSFGFNQGDIFVEGAYQLQNKVVSPEGSDSKSKKTDFNFTPKVGYFLNDKFAVGVELGFGKADISDKTHVNTTSAGVFGRYYFLELGKRFKTYAEVGLGYAGSKGTTNNLIIKNDEVKGNGMYAGLTAGMNYFVTEKIAIGFSLGTVLGYNSMSYKENDIKTYTESNTQVNLNVFNNFFDNAAFSLTYKF